ncbi:4446_t:CDS:1, partial [Funneliformis mosseae]
FVIDNRLANNVVGLLNVKLADNNPDDNFTDTSSFISSFLSLSNGAASQDLKPVFLAILLAAGSLGFID